jgi:hypothetical protein
MSLYVMFAGFAVLVLVAVIAGLWVRVIGLERDLRQAKERQKEFWDEWHSEKWLVRSALATLGLERVPAASETWKLPGGKLK